MNTQERKNTQRTKVSKQIKFIAIFSIMLGIEAIICFTPLGTIPLGPVSATLSAIPVCIAGCVLGIRGGALLGFFFGLFSFIYWTFIGPASPSAILFTPWHTFDNIIQSYFSLVICFIPRILIGVIAGFMVKIIKFKKEHNPYIMGVKWGISCIVASLVHTILVLFGTYFIWKIGGQINNEVAIIFNVSVETFFKILILTPVYTNGIIEALLAGLLAVFLAYPLTLLIKK